MEKFNIPLINCEVEREREREGEREMQEIMMILQQLLHQLDQSLKYIFQLYVPVVALSKENDIKLLEQLKSGFKKL